MEGRAPARPDGLDRGREDRGSPSLRTGRADLPHPALQLVVYLSRIDMNAWARPERTARARQRSIGPALMIAPRPRPLARRLRSMLRKRIADQRSCRECWFHDCVGSSQTSLATSGSALDDDPQACPFVRRVLAALCPVVSSTLLPRPSDPVRNGSPESRSLPSVASTIRVFSGCRVSPVSPSIPAPTQGLLRFLGRHRITKSSA